MTSFNSAHEILDFAIEREIEAEKFYLELAQRTRTAGMKEIFESYAKEERGHQQKLRAIKQGRVQSLPKASQAQDMKLADYLVASDATDNMTYQDALILAMKREKAAFLLYTAVAQRIEDPELRAIFETLANEEAKHKMRFEIEYDEVILAEN